MCSIESLKQQSVKSVHISWQTPMWALSFVLCWCEDRRYWEPLQNWGKFCLQWTVRLPSKVVYHSMSSLQTHVCTHITNSSGPHPGCSAENKILPANWGRVEGWWGDWTPRERWGPEMNTGEPCWIPTKSDMTEHGTCSINSQSHWIP